MCLQQSGSVQLTQNTGWIAEGDDGAATRRHRGGGYRVSGSAQFFLQAVDGGDGAGVLAVEQPEVA